MSTHNFSALPTERICININNCTRSPCEEISAVSSQFACWANQHPKSTTKKKSPQTFAHLVNFSQMCLPCLIITQSCYFDYRINKPLFTWSRRSTRKKDHGLFILITHKSTRSDNPIACCVLHSRKSQPTTNPMIPVATDWAQTSSTYAMCFDWTKTKRNIPTSRTDFTWGKIKHKVDEMLVTHFFCVCRV